MIICSCIRPRHMRLDNQNQSIHYFHAYGVRDRIDLSNFSDETRVPQLASIDLSNLLPSPSDERALQTNFAVFMGRVLRKNIPFFTKFGKCMDKRITHEYSLQMERKSEVVSTIVVNEEKITLQFFC